MEWESDYVVYRTGSWALLRLVDGDRFGPYLVSMTYARELGRSNMTAFDALAWLTHEGGVACTDAYDMIYDAEDYISQGADQCRYLPVDARGV